MLSTVTNMHTVSTHSHPKVAALSIVNSKPEQWCFNTQPPEGGCPSFFCSHHARHAVSTHSHPKVAANISQQKVVELTVSTHSHPKVAALWRLSPGNDHQGFQHTATRRWLLIAKIIHALRKIVSTHSHPKVAAPYLKKQEKSAY